MATSKKFSQLPAASSVGNGDLFAIAHEDALAETGYVSQKLTAAQAGQKVNGDTEYPTGLPSFPTGSQNPFDALEKLNADIEALYPVNTASGSIANFTTSLVKPLVGLSSTIVAQQAGSGTPSPSNPRAISGYTGMNINHSDADTTNPTVYPITFPAGAGTVYGGYVDYARQKLVVTYGITDLGDYTYTKQVLSGSRNAFYFNYTTQRLPEYPLISETSLVGNTCSIAEEIYQTASSWGTNKFLFTFSAGTLPAFSFAIIVNQSYCDDATEFKSLVTGQKLVYKLSTPLEYDLTNLPEIVTLIGTNNIWNDCNGNTEVSFKQSIQEYIDAQIAATQALIL